MSEDPVEALGEQTTLEEIEQACMENRISTALLERASAMDRGEGPEAARARFLHGNVLYRLDRDARALELFQEAERMAIELADPRTLALAVVRQVEWAVFHGARAQAEARLEEALARVDLLGEPYHRARPRASRARLLELDGQRDEAARWHEEAAALYEQAGASRTGAQCRARADRMRIASRALREEIDASTLSPEDRSFLAWFFCDEAFNRDDDPGAALAWAQRALALQELDARKRLLLQISSVDWHLRAGNVQAADAALGRCPRPPEEEPDLLRIFELNHIAMALVVGREVTPEQQRFLLSDRAIESDDIDLTSHCNRALFWIHRGALPRALDELEEARHKLRERGELESCHVALLVLQLLAFLLSLLDRDQDALDALEEIHAWEDRLSPLEEATLQFRRGTLLQRTGEAAEAVDCFLRVLDLTGNEPHRPPVYVLAVSMLGDLLAAGDDEEAKEDIRALLGQLVADEQTPPQLQGRLRYQLALLDESIEQLLDSAEHSLRAGVLVDGVWALEFSGFLLEIEGDLGRSLAVSRRAAALFDELLATAPDDENRILMTAHARNLRARLVRLLWDSSPEEAFREMVWAKSSALLSLKTRRLQALCQAQPVRLSSYPDTVLRALAASGDPAALRAGPPVHIDLASVKALHRRLTESDPVTRVLSQEQAVPVPDILAALPEDTALVELFTHEQEFFGFLVWRGRLHPFRRALPGNLAEMLASLRVAFRDGVGPGSAGQRITRAALRRLHDVLVAPWLAAASGATRVLICPDGQLAAVPFAALEDPEGRVLLEQFELSQLLSSAQLALPPRRPSRRGVVALVRGEDGPSPLPHASAELDALEELCAGHGRPSLRLPPDASLAQIRAAIEQAEAWHFAGHAGFVEARGMAAYLATPERPWTAAELLDLDLAGMRLCMLSACEAGRVASDRGDEQVGLLRALSVAGVESLVCSSWPVEDASTAQVARWFYERWLAGERPSAALRGAQLALRSGTRAERHPWAWANFTAYGPLHRAAAASQDAPGSP